jgi:hypothetical protein
MSKQTVDSSNIEEYKQDLLVLVDAYQAASIGSQDF